MALLINDPVHAFPLPSMTGHLSQEEKEDRWKSDE
jgi:hypothetical protein